MTNAMNKTTTNVPHGSDMLKIKIEKTHTNMHQQKRDINITCLVYLFQFLISNLS